MNRSSITTRAGHEPDCDLGDLGHLSRSQLRDLWQKEVGEKPPGSFGRELLALGIAYVRQERRYGGLRKASLGITFWDYLGARLAIPGQTEIPYLPNIIRHRWNCATTSSPFRRPAMQRGQDGIYAWVLMPGDVVQVRMIESGPTTGDQTIITSGLSQGTASFSTARASPTASPALCGNRA